jgi:predicted lipoprotein with Yx(FWY)xxD motif
VAAAIGLVAPPATAGASTSTALQVGHSKVWGSILQLANGRTVYRLTADPANKSVCAGQCAKVWPPVTLAPGQPTPVGHGVSGLGTITRSNGTRQVTVDGEALYLYRGDHKAGQANGNIKDTWGQWWVVDPSHPTATPTATNHAGGGTATTAAGSGVAY